MTIDVEEWFTGVADCPHELERFESRLELAMTRTLDLLERTESRATFFFLGYLAERWPIWVKRVVERGHEIAVHGHYHTPLWQMTPDEFRASVSRARMALLDAGATVVTGFRAPMFSVNARTLWALDVLEELGFEYDSSIFPILNPRYGYRAAPRLPFRATSSGRFSEFPISTAEIAGARLPFSGGFYLRLLPLWLVRRGFQRCFEAGEPAVCYLHPWELDPEQPKLPGSVSGQLRHRLGLETVQPKLEALLREFKFVPMNEVLRSHMGSQKAPLFRLLQPQPAQQLQGKDPPRI